VLPTSLKPETIVTGVSPLIAVLVGIRMQLQYISSITWDRASWSHELLKHVHRKHVVSPKEQAGK
jgi:hypothetical protein